MANSKKPARSGRKTSKRPKAKRPVATTKAAAPKVGAKTSASPPSLSDRIFGRRRSKKPTVRPLPLPNVLRLTAITGRLLWLHKGLFAGIALVYGVLNLILVQGLANATDVSNLKTTITQVVHGHFSNLVSGIGSFVTILSSAGTNANSNGGAYQTILALLASLAIIWALRQVLSGAKIRIRDAYYRGIYPLVPFVLTLTIIGLQLLPLLVGASLFGLATTNGIAAHEVDKIAWIVVFLILTIWSLYMISSSVIGLYVVTLPDMAPIKALRSARELVRGQRLSVLRKILFLPLLLLIVTGVIMVPVIIFLTPLASWIFFILNMLALLVVHTYIYSLYRELLDE